MDESRSSQTAPNGKHTKDIHRLNPVFQEKLREVKKNTYFNQFICSTSHTDLALAKNIFAHQELRLLIGDHVGSSNALNISETHRLPSQAWHLFLGTLVG